MTVRILVATHADVLRIDPESGSLERGRGLSGFRPTALAASPGAGGRAWCATDRGGVFRSDDGGESWTPSGLEGERLMAVAASRARLGVVWAGGEPSRVWRSDDGGGTWRSTAELASLPSAPEWAFPPRPETHHVRWIGDHPEDPDRLWVAIEAGALVRTADGGRSWRDRVPGGPYDTHELAVHPAAPEVLRVSAGDGYFESLDGGGSWTSPMEGLDVGYLRSVAVDPGDPETVVVSAASSPRATYVSGRSDGRLYRRSGGGAWERITAGWPHPPATIAPLLLAGSRAGEVWAADDRGLHLSEDGGVRWRPVCAFDPAPDHLRGIAVVELAGETPAG